MNILIQITLNSMSDNFNMWITYEFVPIILALSTGMLNIGVKNCRGSSWFNFLPENKYEADHLHKSRVKLILEKICLQGISTKNPTIYQGLFLDKL